MAWVKPELLGGEAFVWVFSNFIRVGWKPERKTPTFLPLCLHRLFPSREGIADLSGQNPRHSLGLVLVGGTAGLEDTALPIPSLSPPAPLCARSPSPSLFGFGCSGQGLAVRTDPATHFVLV